MMPFFVPFGFGAGFKRAQIYFSYYVAVHKRQSHIEKQVVFVLFWKVLICFQQIQVCEETINFLYCTGLRPPTEIQFKMCDIFSKQKLS